MKNLLLILIFAFSTGSINAQIIYTDINPDIVLKGTLSNPWSQYELDLNNDASPDFVITHFYPSYDLFYVEMSCNQYKDCEVLVDESQTPKSLNLNEAIGPEQSLWFDSKSNALHIRENWVGAKDKYLGLRIKNDGHWYYGWIRLDIPQDESSCTIKDYAYESSVDKGLKAGDAISSVKNDDNNNSIIVFPNPVINTLNIKGIIPGRNLSIINIFSQVLFEKQISELQESIDVSNFPNGIYILRIENEQRKILINK